MDLVVLANTILVRGGISGGDIVLPNINKYWQGKFELRVMTNAQGRLIWDTIGSKAEFILLPHLWYEDFEIKITFLLTYIIRTFFAIPLLRRILKSSCNDSLEKKIILSSSDFFPDVLPAYFAKNRNTLWIARVYHLIDAPHKRKGSLLFNFVSFILQKLSLRLIKARADMILTPIGTYRELCALGFDQEKISVSNPGVNLEFIDSVRPLSYASDAISIGALLYNKGSYDIVKIWSKVVKDLNASRLIVIGGGPRKEVELFRKSIENHNLSGNIEYLGFVKDSAQVYARLKSSKILILTGHENGWSMPVSEAFACGVPVVAYNLKMFGTAFYKGFITVPLHDIDSFAQKIIDLLHDDNKRQFLAKEAYAQGRRLGWDKVAADLASAINSLVAKNKNGQYFG